MASDGARRAYKRARDAADNGGTDARTYAASLIADMAAAMAGADEPIDYLIDRFAAPGFLTIVVGRHSAYKSWLLMCLAAATHAGRTGIAGLDVDRRARCTSTQRTAAGCWAALQKRPACPPRRSSSPMPSGGSPPPPSRRAPRARGAERGAARRPGLAAAARTRRQGERLGRDRAVARELAALARELNIAIVLIHHRLDQSRRTRATRFLVDRGPGGPYSRSSASTATQSTIGAGCARSNSGSTPSRRLAGSGSAMSARTSRSTPPTHSTAPMTRVATGRRHRGARIGTHCSSCSSATRR